MSLSSIQLDAFLAVARTQNFTQAAVSLNVTQSALSQRIKNLEDDLGVTLFTRNPARLTDVGHRLLRTCQAREAIEGEFIESLQGSDDLRGILRVIAYSTIARSLVLPALKPVLSEFVQLDFQTAELHEMTSRLTSGRADFVFTNEPIRREDVISKLIGHERNVVVQGRTTRPNIFLDHDEKDTTTIDYFRSIDRELPKGFRRAFFGDIETLLAGVQMGLGRAIAPRHLIDEIKGLEMTKGFAEQRVPVYLCYFEQPFYSRLQTAALAALESTFT